MHPIPESLRKNYVNAFDLAIEIGIPVDTLRMTLAKANVPVRLSDGVEFYPSDSARRAALVELRGKSILEAPEAEPIAEELTVAAGTLPVGPLRFRSVGFREGDDA